MMKVICLLAAAYLCTYSSYAFAVMPQCETKESRGLRFTSEAMSQAAEESDPWRKCEGDGCTMQTSVVDAMDATKRKFESESKAALFKARALEANECPQWSDAIMAGIDIPKDKSVVVKKYNEYMQKNYYKLTTLKKWQKDHPQCKHVEWWGALGSNGTSSSGSHEDLSGKSGICSVDFRGPPWLGVDDSIDNYDPTKNHLIAKGNCARALHAVGAFNGSYADPKFCSDMKK